MTRRQNFKPGGAATTGQAASVKELAAHFGRLSPADRLFIEGWFAEEDSLRGAIDAVAKQALDLKDTGLRLGMLTITNGKVEYVLAHRGGVWEIFRTARGRPSTAVRQRQAATKMRKAKELLRPVAKSLRKHVRDVRNRTAMKGRIWHEVERDCGEVRLKLGAKTWRQMVAETDLQGFTLDSLAASLVGQVMLDYKPSVLARLGRSSI